MKLQDYDVTTRFEAKVLSNQRITAVASKEDVREISIEVESQSFDVKVGQNFGVLAPGQHAIGQDYHFRLYTVADLPHRTSNGHHKSRSACDAAAISTNTAARSIRALHRTICATWVQATN